MDQLVQSVISKKINKFQFEIHEHYQKGNNILNLAKLWVEINEDLSDRTNLLYPNKLIGLEITTELFILTFRKPVWINRNENWSTFKLKYII